MAPSVLNDQYHPQRYYNCYWHCISIFQLVLKAGNKGMLKITSIDSLIECVELYKTTSKSSEESDKISLFFEKYLKEVAHLAQVKKFFHDTIYHSLYEFFYDPVHDDSEDDAELGQSLHLC